MRINKEKLKQEICKIVNDNWEGKTDVSITIEYSINNLPKMTIQTKSYNLNCINYED